MAFHKTGKTNTLGTLPQNQIKDAAKAQPTIKSQTQPKNSK